MNARDNLITKKANIMGEQLYIEVNRDNEWRNANMSFYSSLMQSYIHSLQTSTLRVPLTILPTQAFKLCTLESPSDPTLKFSQDI